MARLTKKAAQDLVAGRGSWKANVSRILYYGFVQNLIFAECHFSVEGAKIDGTEVKFSDVAEPGYWATFKDETDSIAEWTYIEVKTKGLATNKLFKVEK